MEPGHGAPVEHLARRADRSQQPRLLGGLQQQVDEVLRQGLLIFSPRQVAVQCLDARGGRGGA